MKAITTEFVDVRLYKTLIQNRQISQSLDLCPKLSDYEFLKEVIKIIVSSICKCMGNTCQVELYLLHRNIMKLKTTAQDKHKIHPPQKIYLHVQPL